MFTDGIDELGLRPVTFRLYGWLLRLAPPETVIEFKISDFAEYSVGIRNKTERPYSERQIKRGIKELEEKGVLHIVRRWYGGVYKCIVTVPGLSPEVLAEWGFSSMAELYQAYMK